MDGVSGTARSESLAAGLYLVAVPIGAARDITLRTLDILASADLLVAEDTRSLRRLMEIHGIALGGRKVLAYHDHSGEGARRGIVEAVAQGRSVAYAAEAGTPLVADPGFRLARAVRERGGAVTSAPGASAVLAALLASGLPTDRFLFAGFLPPTKGARQKAIAELAAVPATLVVYEAGGKCLRTLREMMPYMEEREAALCRELTKRFEEVRRGSVAALADGCADDPPRGEVVLVVDRDRDGPGADDLEAALRHARQSMSVSAAARRVAEDLGLPRRDVYQAALRLDEEDEG